MATQPALILIYLDAPLWLRPNIFLSKAEGGHAKLGDFGLSTELAGWELQCIVDWRLFDGWYYWIVPGVSTSQSQLTTNDKCWRYQYDTWSNVELGARRPTFPKDIQRWSPAPGAWTDSINRLELAAQTSRYKNDLGFELCMSCDKSYIQLHMYIYILYRYTQSILIYNL